MKGKEIIEQLEKNYCGLETVKYKLRYQNGVDNRAKNIHWLMNTFDCSWHVANRIVAKANHYYVK